MTYHTSHTILLLACLISSSLQSTSITPGMAISFLRGLSTHTPTLLGYKSQGTAEGLFYIGINGVKYMSQTAGRESTIDFYFDPYKVTSLPVKVLAATGIGIGLGLIADRTLKFKTTAAKLLSASLIGQATGYAIQKGFGG